MLKLRQYTNNKISNHKRPVIIQIQPLLEKYIQNILLTLSSYIEFLFSYCFFAEIEVSSWNQNKDIRLIHILNVQENYYDCIAVKIRILSFISFKLFSFHSNRLKPYIYFECVGIDTQWAEDSFDIHWLIYIFILQLSKLTVEPNLHFLINSFFIC